MIFEYKESIINSKNKCVTETLLEPELNSNFQRNISRNVKKCRSKDP